MAFQLQGCSLLQIYLTIVVWSLSSWVRCTVDSFLFVFSLDVMRCAVVRTGIRAQAYPFLLFVCS